MAGEGGVHSRGAGGGPDIGLLARGSKQEIQPLLTTQGQARCPDTALSLFPGCTAHQSPRKPVSTWKLLSPRGSPVPCYVRRTVAAMDEGRLLPAQSRLSSSLQTPPAPRELSDPHPLPPGSRGTDPPLLPMRNHHCFVTGSIPN